MSCCPDVPRSSGGLVWVVFAEHRRWCLDLRWSFVAEGFAAVWPWGLSMRCGGGRDLVRFVSLPLLLPSVAKEVGTPPSAGVCLDVVCQSWRLEHRPLLGVERDSASMSCVVVSSSILGGLKPLSSQPRRRSFVLAGAVTEAGVELLCVAVLAC